MTDFITPDGVQFKAPESVQGFRVGARGRLIAVTGPHTDYGTVRAAALVWLDGHPAYDRVGIFTCRGGRHVDTVTRSG